MLTARVGPASVWCTGRESGNVGDHVGDDPDAVAHRRAAIAAAAGLSPPDRWVWLRQVHGAHVVDCDRPPSGGAPEADAAVTATRDLPIAVVTADCAPIVLASEAAVSVVHAGHKGLAAGVVEAAVAQVRAHGDDRVRAFLGPCIHPERYEFGAADLAELVMLFGPGVEARTETGQRALDIPAAVRVVLARAGVDELEDCDVCTSASPAYFSHRRDGHTGRQATIAVLQ